MALPNRGGSESPSRTMRLANLVNIGRRNGSERKDRNDNERERERERLSVSPSAPKTLALPYPSPYVTVSNSVSSPSVISRSRGNSGNSLQLRPPDDSTNYNQLYYQVSTYVHICVCWVAFGQAHSLQELAKISRNWHYFEQAQVAHLQTALVKEHALVVRVVSTVTAMRPVCLAYILRLCFWRHSNL